MNQLIFPMVNVVILSCEINKVPIIIRKHAKEKIYFLENKLIKFPAKSTTGNANIEEINIEIDMYLAELKISNPAIVISEPNVALLAFSSPYIVLRVSPPGVVEEAIRISGRIAIT